MTLRRRLLIAASLPLLALAAACGGPESSGSSTAAQAAPAAAPAAPAGPGTPMSAAGITFDLPAGWTPEVPSSAMRAAQVVVPGSGGPGQMVLFYFGPGQGGGVEANLQRWVGQMAAEPGTQPTRDAFTSGPYQVTWMEMAGTLKASQIGSFPATDMPGYRMLAAVVEGENGPWFFRAVGPDATLAEQRDAFLAMIRSVRTG
ncbi:MAG TPA: hypothetical protein VMV46_22965 [Thermoanaerobaculia bacterium]|nr:hypothetical protein [Thermoanaerobaculia bacterium]